MSIAVMNWVWANSPTSGNERLALADTCFRDAGTGCLPSAATIGRKANLSDRTVPRVIARLEADGYVVVHRGMAASPPPDQRSKTHADHRAGMVPLAAGQVIGQRARAELRACGVSVPAVEPGGLAELTPQQRQIGYLASSDLNKPGDRRPAFPVLAHSQLAPVPLIPETRSHRPPPATRRSRPGWNAIGSRPERRRLKRSGWSRFFTTFPSDNEMNSRSQLAYRRGRMEGNGNRARVQFVVVT